ncbi:MAG: MarR family transcriptional regulator [SAR202 cluster bacterium Io17-Chloro-G7]|nr:MAG: MarR family transcriptional regulator [SAR202 cluster bacterium Io17-Chloro-G7]
MACACGNLRAATRAVTQLYDEVFQPLGLRATQFSLLAAVDYMDTITITALAEFFEMDRTTMTRNLRPLEREGYLTINEGQDRRTREVKLTGQGRGAVAQGLPLWDKAQRRVVNGMGQENFDAFLKQLEEVSTLARGP